MQIYRDIEQGSDEWFQVRAGIPTASEFSKILAKGAGKTRRSYMLKLAGEILTGEPAENFSTTHTRRGHEQEPLARTLYGFAKGLPVEQVGFIRNGDQGASPDGLIGDDGGLEIKTKLPHLHLEVLLADEVPNEHMAQIDGLLWISEREWWDFMSYCPRMEPFVKRVYRNEERIKTLANAVDAFNAELHEIVEQARAKQGVSIELPREHEHETETAEGIFG